MKRSLAIVLIGAAAFGAVMAGGCALGPRVGGVRGPDYDTPDVIAGTYEGPQGNRATVMRDLDSTGYLLSVRPAAGGEEKVYPAFVRVVGPADARRRILEVEVGEAKKGRALVYMYGVLDIGPGMPTTYLDFRRLRTEWVREQAGELRGVDFEPVQEGEVEGVIVSGKSNMAEVLERAVMEPDAALEAPERWTRAAATEVSSRQ